MLIMCFLNDHTGCHSKLFSIVVKQEGGAAEGVGGKRNRQLCQQRVNDLLHVVDTINK